MPPVCGPGGPDVDDPVVAGRDVVVEPVVVLGLLVEGAVVDEPAVVVGPPVVGGVAVVDGSGGPTPAPETNRSTGAGSRPASSTGAVATSVVRCWYSLSGTLGTRSTAVN
jgi:hypothetical protein